MTQKTQWLLCGAIFGVAALGAWALVRYAGLGSPPPVAPVGPVVLNPGQNAGNRGNAGQPPATPPNSNNNTPPTPGQAVLPFGNRGGGGGGSGQPTGQAALPNFGTGGGGASGRGTGGSGGAPGGGANLPAFGTPPGGANARGPAPAGGAQLPFAPNNAVATLTPTDNRPAPAPAGGAALPSFGTNVTGAGSVGPAGSNANAGAIPGLIQGAALVPPFMIDQSDPNAIAKHYLRQLCGERMPTLADWQKLADLKLPDAAKWLKAPIGRGHFVMAMCLDKQNYLWVGEEAGENSGGLYRFSPADGMWRHFTAKDGLGDDSIYALATDHQGRVWAGTLNHGVSVWNGERWQVYEVVGGLSKPGTLNGPLGERIFKIAVCNADVPSATFKDPLTDKESPMSGSVWMASSAGLAIYFPATDTWSYVTRAEGLPSDQANAIAFDQEGRVFIGHQCDGISIGTPADHYATWQQVTAANPTPHPVDGKIIDFPVPTTGKGPGLPTDLINDLLVAKDGTVYAATTLGLAWSTGKGQSWQYVRGADWVDKVKNRFGGPPKGWQAPTDSNKGGGILAEDYTTALAEDAEGNLLVGHRAAGGEILTSQAKQKLDSSANLYVTSMMPIPGTKSIFLGTYSEGISAYKPNEGVLKRTMPSSKLNGEALKFPSGVLAEDVGKILREVDRAASQASRSAKGSNVAVLNDDWATQGNWINHVGRFASILCAQGGNGSDLLGGHRGAWFSWRPFIGENLRDNDVLRYWLDPTQLNDTRSLQNAVVGGSRQSSWDDHGEDYPFTWSGPDLYCTLKLPKGEYVVSLYFVNYRGHWSDFPYQLRDYTVDCRLTSTSEAEYRQLGRGNRKGQSLFGSAPAVARSRVNSFWGGTYKRFYVNATDTPYCTVRVDRNFSLNAILSGVFVDSAGTLCGPGGPLNDVATPRVPVENDVLRNNAAGQARLLVDHLLAYRDAAPLSYRNGTDRLRIAALRSLLCSTTGLDGCLARSVVMTEPDFRKDLAECLRDQRLFNLFDRVYIDEEFSQLMRWEMATTPPSSGAAMEYERAERDGNAEAMVRAQNKIIDEFFSRRKTKMIW